MKRITLSLVVVLTLCLYGQNVTKQELEKEVELLNKSITILQTENQKLKQDLQKLNSKLSDFVPKMDSLQKQIEINNDAIDKANKDLSEKISTTESNANQKIIEVDNSLSKNTLYGIIGALSIFLVFVFLYLILSKRQKSDKDDFIDQLSKTKLSIEESLIKEFGKQTELMDSQLHLIEQQKTNLQATNLEPDHSLALNVADQIVIIERSIGLMDEKTKGIQRIKNSITNLKDNLSANGYEMPELIGKSFNQGMKIIVASSIPDENLKKGEEIITRIVKPHVNFNDKMIQAAQVEVSVGY